MKLISAGTLTLLLLFAAECLGQNPSPYEVAKKEMLKLKPLTGKWKASLSISQDRGKTWNNTSPNTVEIGYQMKDLLLHQQNVPTSHESWNSAFSITYDQYRQIFRMSIVDDTWGMMDIYEGTFNENNQLVLNNLNSKTFFPGPNDTWLAFRVVMNILPCKTHYNIDVSPDYGQQWIPYMKYQFEQLENKNC